jgi:hypothetical protein
MGSWKAQLIWLLWAEVVGVVKEDGESDVYKVKDVNGDVHDRPRHLLRHWVWEKEAHIGVSDDKKHDSYSMQAFVESSI